MSILVNGFKKNLLLSTPLFCLLIFAQPYICINIIIYVFNITSHQLIDKSNNDENKKIESCLKTNNGTHADTHSLTIKTFFFEMGR